MLTAVIDLLSKSVASYALHTPLFSSTVNIWIIKYIYIS
jgi:hypothetical protein